MSTTELTTLEARALALITPMTTTQLVDAWETMDTPAALRRSETSTIRGWIMDELERRNPAAFTRWLDESITVRAAFS